VGRIPEETIEQVLSATDIVDVISGYLPLSRAGSNFKANCPFHNEKTPSFMVNPSRQSYHCFGCGAGGSAIGFVMAYENLPFPDAIKKLASRAGVPIQEEAYDPEADKRHRNKSRLLELHNGAARFMHELLMTSPDAQHARDYLKSRGYGRGMAERWLVGWAPEYPNQFLDWARSNKFTGRELCDSGLAAPKDAGGLYLRFRDRLMFPIYNDYGDIIAFSGRQLKEDPRSGKYINSPETNLFKKSKVFFALDKARRSMTKDKFALICEGQIDVIACHEAGITSAIATLGTACTPEHARLLKRYTKDAVICFDSDAAGFKAADKAFAIMSAEGIHIRMATMPDGEDPDSLMKKQGTETFRSTRLGIGVEELRGGVVRAEKKQRRTQFYETRQTAKENQDAETAPRAIPTPINSSVGYLCHLALTSQNAQDWLGEQLESLNDALTSLPGGSILLHILSRCPDPNKPAAVQIFIR